MTQTALEKGIEIDRTIGRLKSILSEISKERLFPTDGISGTCSREAMPFLVDLELSTKTNLNKVISDRIFILEQEFKSL